MKVVACSVLFVILLTTASAAASDAIRFVGYTSNACGSTGSVVLNRTANMNECFSFTNTLNGTETCAENYVLRDASTFTFDRYSDANCQTFVRSETFSPTTTSCVLLVPGVTDACSGAKSYRVSTVAGSDCAPNCVGPAATSSASAALSVNHESVFTIIALGVVAVMFLWAIRSLLWQKMQTKPNTWFRNSIEHHSRTLRMRIYQNRSNTSKTNHMFHYRSKRYISNRLTLLQCVCNSNKHHGSYALWTCLFCDWPSQSQVFNKDIEVIHIGQFGS